MKKRYKCVHNDVSVLRTIDLFNLHLPLSLIHKRLVDHILLHVPLYVHKLRRASLLIRMQLDPEKLFLLSHTHR